MSQSNPQESKKLALTLNWKVTVFGLLLLPILMYLGFWQLDRADQKQQLLDQVAQQKQLPVVDGFPNDGSLQHRKIKLTGRFDQRKYWLLDNKVLRGRVGYEIVSPFILNNKSVALVNRGWVQAPPTRDKLPDVSIPKGDMTITGYLHQPTNNKMINNIERSIGWPKRIQKLDLSLLEHQFGQAFIQSHILRISATNSAALEVDWKIVNSSTAKHQGYAVQWFLMAAVLLIALIFANSNLAEVSGFKKNH